MPTHDELKRFPRDYDRLTRAQQDAFMEAVALFVEDLRTGHFRPGLRVRGVQGAGGIYEMTWAPDGRATFQHGAPVRNGHPHVMWRRVGTHASFKAP